MRAAILVEQRQPLVIGEVELPSTLDVGQVLVRIHYSGVCGSQLGEIDGAKGEDRFLPHLLGHEGSGTVVEVGPGVGHVTPGDKVVLHWRRGLGIEARPPVYTWNGRHVNAGWVTTFNTYAVVSENRLTVIPPDSDMAVAVLFGCAVTTGFGVVVNDARLSIGESVVIFGTGGVGLNVVQGAALVSAFPIIAVDRFDAKLEMAKGFGATHTVNSTTRDAREAILEAAGRSGVDVFIDNTGAPEVIELGYEITKPQGRVILVGVPNHDHPASIPTLPLHFGKVLKGSHGGEAVPHQDIPRYQELFRAGRLRLRELITDYASLDEINAALERLRRGDVRGRCLIEM